MDRKMWLSLDISQRPEGSGRFACISTYPAIWVTACIMQQHPPPRPPCRASSELVLISWLSGWSLGVFLVTGSRVHWELRKMFLGCSDLTPTSLGQSLASDPFLLDERLDTGEKWHRRDRVILSWKCRQQREVHQLSHGQPGISILVAFTGSCL